MREFLSGWRRKVGCVALVMACVVMGMWMRSMACHDFVRVASKHRVLILVSDRGKITIHVSRVLNDFKTLTWEYTYLDKYHLRTNFMGIWPQYHQTLDQWGVVTSYWQLVFPTTLLSAYLILWKPRPKERRDA